MEPAAPTYADQTCYRHSDRKAGVRCQRCERPICPQCMHSASVGFHCPECASGGQQKVYTRATLDRAAAAANRPWLSQALIAVNVAVFFLGVALDRGQADLLRLSEELGLRGALFSESLLDRTTGELFRGVAEGGWYRVVTAGFLHAGLIHLAFNMFALYRIGQALEPAIGRARFAAAYGASLLVGSLGVLLVSPNQPTVGASGAIFGLFGVLFMAARSRGIDPWSSGIGMTIGINLLITFGIPGISIGGHIGGLVGGLIVGYLYFEVGPRQLDVTRQVAAVVALGVVAAVAAVLVV
ncbi:MAG: rhomboid family intramembrane serine protease [Acidimicrobiia bacterium]|nr:rhomboid family intramembrane serine protease [Acidimicrobiia bacterium]